MIIAKSIEAYINAHATPEDPLLAELNRETHLKAINPRMLSGHPQGLLLQTISKMLRPNNILEIGTFTGYSAICLAKGLKLGGQLHTIEKNDEIIHFSKKYFKKANLNNSIFTHIGNALDIIPTLNYTFDLVFMDGNKQQYLDYYNLCLEKLSSGGIILADNVLWDGKVTQEYNPSDSDTVAINNFNKTIMEDNRVEVIILPIRDGISLIRKR
jgi:predicted O-methyltransferase YrrM